MILLNPTFFSTPLPPSFLLTPYLTFPNKVSYKTQNSSITRTIGQHTLGIFPLHFTLRYMPLSVVFTWFLGIKVGSLHISSKCFSVEVSAHKGLQNNDLLDVRRESSSTGISNCCWLELLKSEAREFILGMFTYNVGKVIWYKTISRCTKRHNCIKALPKVYVTSSTKVSSKNKQHVLC